MDKNKNWTKMKWTKNLFQKDPNLQYCFNPSLQALVVEYR